MLLAGDGLHKRFYSSRSMSGIIVYCIGTIRARLYRDNIEIKQLGELIMKSDVRIVGDIKVLDWSGKITLGEETMAVRNTVRDIVKSGGKKLVLNLANVSYIDSAGVGELVSTYTTVTNAGGELKLLNLTKRIKEVLAITKLLTVFDVYENEEEALRSFK